MSCIIGWCGWILIRHFFTAYVIHHTNLYAKKSNIKKMDYLLQLPLKIFLHHFSSGQLTSSRAWFTFKMNWWGNTCNRYWDVNKTALRYFSCWLSFLIFFDFDTVMTASQRLKNDICMHNDRAPTTFEYSCLFVTLNSLCSGPWWDHFDTPPAF